MMSQFCVTNIIREMHAHVRVYVCIKLHYRLHDKKLAFELRDSWFGPTCWHFGRVYSTIVLGQLVPCGRIWRWKLKNACCAYVFMFIPVTALLPVLACLRPRNLVLRQMNREKVNIS